MDLYSKTDFNEPSNQVYCVLLTIFSCFSIYVLCWVLSLPLATYRNLSPREKVFWSLSVVRATVGGFLAIEAAYSLSNEDELWNDVARGTAKLSTTLVCVATGFFAFELLAIFSSAFVFGKLDKFLALHHVLAFFSFALVMHRRTQHFFADLALLLELSTPFSCLCWVLLKAKVANTSLWKINQLILIHAFHCRSFIETFVLYKTWKHWDLLWSFASLDLLVLHLIGLVSSFFFLTPYWTHKKTKQYYDPVDWNHPEVKRTKKD
ncbi:protein CLN8-like [Oscarella lobularis]|uniref:protein CLN8-like n=1 Tax=Oscarella lobularis TaxID=121494 RepID=UPI00331331C9